jgi:hypothetical protein
MKRVKFSEESKRLNVSIEAFFRLSHTNFI